MANPCLKNSCFEVIAQNILGQSDCRILVISPKRLRNDIEFLFVDKYQGFLQFIAIAFGRRG